MLTYFIFILSATEYRNWLLHYSVPVLKGVLPDHYFLHYTLLVTAIAILVSDRITPEQLKLADELLDTFCKLMPELYGEYIYFSILVIVFENVFLTASFYIQVFCCSLIRGDYLNYKISYSHCYGKFPTLIFWKP